MYVLWLRALVLSTQQQQEMLGEATGDCRFLKVVVVRWAASFMDLYLMTCAKHMVYNRYVQTGRPGWGCTCVASGSVILGVRVAVLRCMYMAM